MVIIRFRAQDKTATASASRNTFSGSADRLGWGCLALFAVRNDVDVVGGDLQRYIHRQITPLVLACNSQSPFPAFIISIQAAFIISMQRPNFSFHKTADPEKEKAKGRAT